MVPVSRRCTQGWAVLGRGKALCPPVATDLFAQCSERPEVGGRRREWEGEREGGEIEEVGGGHRPENRYEL